MAEPRDESDLLPEEHARVRQFLRSEPRPSADELTRRRVIAAAVSAVAPPATPRSSGRAWLAAVAAAFVLVVAVGGAIAMTAGGGRDEPELAGVNDRQVRAAYAGSLRGADPEAIARAAQTVIDRPVPAERVPNGLARCTADVLGGRTLVALASLQFGDEGTPAFAVVVREPADGGMVAVIVARDDCRVLDRVELGT